jgi:ubiquinone/menaquinone biosynthesis C-methylase UbiE
MINIAKAHNQFKNLNYEKVDGKDLSNFPAKSFDFIVSLISLQHSPPKIQYNLLKEMVRVVKDDGVIVVSMVTHTSISHLLRNAIANVSPKTVNYFLQLWQRIRGIKLGHYDVNVASQMFPVSKRKVEVTMRKLGIDFKYINTAELNYTGALKLELFIISPINKSFTNS